MKTQVLPDEGFEQAYLQTVLPFKAEHEKSEYYCSLDTKKLHYFSYEQADTKAPVALLVHGFTECAEKLDELAYYFFNEGYHVFVPDLRGHGLSYKAPAPRYGVSSNDFNEYAEDLAVLVRMLNKRFDNSQTVLFTHSLGGLAALLMLENHKGLPVSGLVLSSPMISGKMGMPAPVAKAVASLMVKTGKGGLPAPGKCVFNPEQTNKDAASAQRERFCMKRKEKNAAYQTCGPDFYWVLASIKARNAVLNEERIKNLTVPMLVLLPQTDGELNEKDQLTLIKICQKQGKSLSVVHIQNTCHEIYQSRQTELEGYLNHIFSFLKK